MFEPIGVSDLWVGLTCLVIPFLAVAWVVRWWRRGRRSDPNEMPLLLQAILIALLVGVLGSCMANLP